MESNWSQKFLYKNGKREMSPILLAFIALQVLLLVAVVFTIMRISDDGVARNDTERYEKMPELTIKGLKEKASMLSENEIKDIQKKTFKIVSENSESINKSTIEATIRDNRMHVKNFGGYSRYINMIVDIPDLKQSYQVFYSSGAVIDPEVNSYVLCLNKEADMTYGDFGCKSSDDESIRETMLKTYLGAYRFEYFSAYIKDDDPRSIIISPSVTYNNSEATMNSYIQETMRAVQDLGFSPNDYTYYVRTAADVNYDNNGK